MWLSPPARELQPAETRKLGLLPALLLRLAGAFKIARTAHRLLYYRLEN